MSKLIHVRAAKRNHKVALWEVSSDQPNGEVFVSGDGAVHEVAETPEVLKAIAAGRIVRVEGDDATLSVSIDPGTPHSATDGTADSGATNAAGGTASEPEHTSADAGTEAQSNADRSEPESAPPVSAKASKASKTKAQQEGAATGASNPTEPGEQDQP